MEFSFTEEQLMIRESAEAFLADVSSSEAVRKVMATEQGYDQEVWRQIAKDMAWTALHIPENYGGIGLGYIDLVVLLEQMGKHLLCSPFFSSICLAANTLLLAGNEEQKQTYLPQLASGALTATLAFSGKNNLLAVDAISCRYEKKNGHFVLNGEYHYVPNGHSVDLLIVAAREQGSSNNEGISLFLLDGNNTGLSRKYLASMDQTKKQARLILNNVQVDKKNLLGTEAGSALVLQNILHLANIAAAAEQVGGIQKVLDMSVEYAKERVQFNRPIAGFQAIKHKAADMMLKAEAAKSAVYYAACIAQDFFENGELASELAEAASIAKAYCSDAYFFNAGSALQIFGGVGFTWEYDVHLYFKRAKSSETFLGNGAAHREHIAKLLLD